MSKKEVSDFMKFAANELAVLSKDADNSEQFMEIEYCVLNMAMKLDNLTDGRVDGAKSKLILSLFSKLSKWEPLTPLTGEEDEWVVCNDPKDKTTDILYQNKRCSHVYKRKDGTCFDSQGTVYSYDGKLWFRNKDSNIDITFPYTVPESPKHIILNKDAIDVAS